MSQSNAEKIRREYEDWHEGASYIDFSPMKIERAEFLKLCLMALRLLDALRLGREQFALMAEGEGPDPEVYKDMSNWSMKEMDKALADCAKILEDK